MISGKKLTRAINQSRKEIERDSRGLGYYEERKNISGELYDIASEKTDNFTNINSSIIRSDPRIIKVLRYLVSPSISQMKLGQRVGVASTKRYEGDELSNASIPSVETAEKLSEFFLDNIDSEKVPWLQNENPPIYVEDILRKWVIDKMAEQDTETWNRMRQGVEQEENIADVLENVGYEEIECLEKFTSKTDIPVGYYLRETVTGTKTKQKADLVVRPSKDTILFIEAKSVGVLLDSHKRVKEVRNKSKDWSDSFPCSVSIAILKGYFEKSDIESMVSEGTHVYWDHRLHEDFKKYVSEVSNFER